MKQPFAPINANFRLVTKEGIKLNKIGEREFLEIDPKVLEKLAEEAFHDSSFYLRETQLEQWVAILKDDEATDNEKYVAGNLLRNAIIASDGLLPLCQDTGTATVVAKRGEMVITGGNDEISLTEGIKNVYEKNHLRYSQIAATSMFEEANTKNNLPGQIDIAYAPGNEYHFLFMAKGGGSTNKTVLTMAAKALLTEKNLEEYLREKIAGLGVAACPPYHLAIVVGGTSPEANLKMMKLAAAGALDHLPTKGTGKGEPFRDLEWEAKAQKIAQETGLGAQFGGKYLTLDARVIRLPRHAGSCPVSIGVSCSAHRNILAKIAAEGCFLEQLETNPAKYLPLLDSLPEIKATKVDLDQPMTEIRKQLSELKVGSLVTLSGTMIVGRDIAHAKLSDIIDSGNPLPEYALKHPIYYAGPAKTPAGMAIGSFGPTTAQRMDSYMDKLMQHGASLISLAKGNRAEIVTQACNKHRGFYLGTIGGAAALLAKENIKSSEVLDFPELGMEAIRKITVKDMPAFIVVDDKGNFLY